jgi:hypothetical protein
MSEVSVIRPAFGALKAKPPLRSPVHRLMPAMTKHFFLLVQGGEPEA